jgi:hypothetical protein
MRGPLVARRRTCPDADAVAAVGRPHHPHYPREAPRRSRLRTGATIVWRRGNDVATLNGSDAARWRLESGSHTYHESHDARAAHVAASNIVVHFDQRYCRGTDMPPFTVDEMARFTNR